MWILWSLWVTIGTVSPFHATCHDLWLQVPWLTHEALAKCLTNYSLQTKRKLGISKFIQATEVRHSHRARALVSALPILNSTYPNKSSVPCLKTTPWVIRPPDLPHWFCQVWGKGNRTGKERSKTPKERSRPSATALASPQQPPERPLTFLQRPTVTARVVMWTQLCIWAFKV